MRLSRGPARAAPRLELPRGVRGPTRLVHFSPPIARGVYARATARVSARPPWPLHGSNARLGHLLTPPAAEPGPLALAIPFGPHDLATALIYGETALATPGTRGRGTVERWCQLWRPRSASSFVISLPNPAARRPRASASAAISSPPT